VFIIWMLSIENRAGWSLPRRSSLQLSKKL
jgi:hypothetical protein